MPVFNGYSYQPLSGKDAIRLVVLDPSTHETAPLTCRIIGYRCSSRSLEYSAISYVWGKHGLWEILEIRCDEDVRYLRITTNVENVLKRFRQRDQPSYLWIDTICFNQSDEVEKAQQIPIMGNIYKTAVAVNIWLGPENHMTPRVLKFLRKLSRLPDVTKWKNQWELAGRIVFLMRKIVHHETYEALSAVLDFFEQPWFSRRWVIQEACLARHGAVHCGRQSINLPSLKQAAVCFQRMDISNYAIKVAANLGSQTSRLSMLELLWHFHDSKSLEPKDRIAAFLGLARDGQDHCLNYTQPWDNMFRDFAFFTYSRGCNDTRLQLLLHLFEFGPVLKREDSSYPSWVPNWSNSRQRTLPYISAPKNLDTYELYPHSPGEFGKANVVFHRGCLQIQRDLSGIGPQSLRVASTATFHCFQGAGDCQKQQVCDIIERLFPSVPQATLHIMALTILLKTVSEFRHPEVERERTSKSLGRFEKAFRAQAPTLDPGQCLMWLRTLESVLCDFCFVELKSFDQDRLIGQGYGIGLELMLVDDLVLPLWSSQADIHIGAFGTSIQLFTMLAVRPHVGKSRNGLDEAGPFQDCKIIGPVICVNWTQATDDSASSSNSGRGQFVDLKHWFSTRIS